MKPYTYIHTIRHAKTTFGEQHRYAGWIDAPLSQRGIRQAREAAKSLKRMKFDAVVSSALRRSIDTARLLVGRRNAIVTSELCNERNFGVLQGLTWTEALQITPEIMFIQVGNDMHSVNPEGSEPFEDLRIRAKKFHRFIFKHYRGKRVLIVSHGVFLQQFHGLLRGISCIESLADYVSNLEITSFTMAGNRLVEEHSQKLLEGDRDEF
jgi:probable phosphoglycerate mutase